MPKLSSYTPVTDAISTDAIVGLRSGANKLFTPTSLGLGATALAQNAVAIAQSAQSAAAAANALSNAVALVAGTQRLALSTYPGITKATNFSGTTGNVDSRAAFLTAMATCITNNWVLAVDLPIYLKIGNDPTLPIFIRSNLKVEFTGTGRLVIDNAFIPAFVFLNATNITWFNARIRYVGTPPSDISGAPYNSGAGGTANNAIFNDTTMKNDMATNFGNTFTNGGSCLYTGRTNPQAIFRLQGACSRVDFFNPLIDVAQTATANNFIPVVMSGDRNWTQNTLVNGNSLANALYPAASVPYDINLYNPILDGYWMGIVGEAGINIIGGTFERYSDCQDAAGNNQGGVGATTGQNPWFAPPHAIYLTDPPGNNWPGPVQKKILDCYDYGKAVWNGDGTRRLTSSGSCLSLKISPSNTTVIDGYTSKRPDGGVDLQFNNPQISAGIMRNISIEFDSSTATLDGGVLWGWRFPSGTPYNFMVISNVSIKDVAATSTQFPILNLTNPQNTNCWLLGWAVYVNDWSGTANYPGFGMAGDNMHLDADYFFNSYSSTTALRGVYANQGTAVMTNSTVDVRVHGFRRYPLTFVNAPVSPYTSATLGSAWPYATGKYQVAFSDNSVRWATLTSAATTCTWLDALPTQNLTLTATPGVGGQTATLTAAFTGQTGNYLVTFSDAETRLAGFTTGYTQISWTTPLTGNPTTAISIGVSTSALVSNVISSSYNSLKNRIQVAQQGKGINNRIRIYDSANGLEQISTNWVQRERWSQQWAGTPPAGANFDLPYSIPATHAVTEVSLAVPVALTTVATMNLGDAANATRYYTGIAATVNTVTQSPLTGPITGSPGTTPRITPNVAFDGAGGILQVTFLCESITATL